HVVQDRALRAAGDDRVGDALDPDARPVASPALLADDRLDRADLVGPRVLAAAGENHPASVSHGPIIAYAVTASRSPSTTSSWSAASSCGKNGSARLRSHASSA